jgi:hypothetical protein
MFRARLLGTLILFAGGSLLIAQDGELKSGPKVGAVIPKSFSCLNVNGPEKELKGRPSCLVCKFALNPAVLVFAREPADADAAFTDLVAKLEELCVEFDYRSFAVGVVILSRDARDSTNNADLKKKKEEFEKTVKEIEPELKKAKAKYDEAAKAAEADKATPEAIETARELRKQYEKLQKQLTDEYGKFGEDLNKEAAARDKLVERLAKRSEKLKHVVVCCCPEDGPKGFDLNPKAEVTVLFYDRLKVKQNYAFAPGALDAKHVDAMVKQIRDALPLKKKAAEEKKKD